MCLVAVDRTLRFFIGRSQDSEAKRGESIRVNNRLKSWINIAFIPLPKPPCIPLIVGGRKRRLFPGTRSLRRGDLGFIVKQQIGTTFDMVVVTNAERGKHPDFIKSVFLGVRSSPQQSRSLASKMLEPIVKTRSIELLSYILYIIGRGARPRFLPCSKPYV